MDFLPRESALNETQQPGLREVGYRNLAHYTVRERKQSSQEIALTSNINCKFGGAGPKTTLSFYNTDGYVFLQRKETH